jgi:SAM-dependent methyltransferase
VQRKFWDDLYRGEGYAYGRAPNDFLLAEAYRIPRGRVLCLAEGEGRNATFLAGLGYTVTAVDLSAVALRKAERLALERWVALDVVQADLTTFEPKKRGFAGIISIFAHLPAAVRKRLHALVPAALVPGGVFLMEAYIPEQIALGTGGPCDPAALAPLEELESELSDGRKPLMASLSA